MHSSPDLGGERENAHADAWTAQRSQRGWFKSGYFRPSVWLAITWRVATRGVTCCYKRGSAKFKC